MKSFLNRPHAFNCNISLAGMYKGVYQDEFMYNSGSRIDEVNQLPTFAS